MSDLQHFLDEIRASDNTKRIYKNTLTLFQRQYGHLPDSSAEAQEYIRKRERDGLSPASIGLDVAAFLRYLKFQGIQTNRLERMPVTLKTPEYLSKKEIATLLASSNQMSVKTLIALLYDSGARISEILGVKVDDIDWNGALMVRRKGGRQEWANVSPWGMDYLAKWMDTRTGAHPKVFGSRNYNDMYRMCKTAAKKAGLPRFKPHMLRHSRAVHLREEGVSWEEIGYQLGHVNPAITLKYYTRPDSYDLKKAIPTVTLE
jgi:integrase/recombinase XerD